MDNKNEYVAPAFEIILGRDAGLLTTSEVVILPVYIEGNGEDFNIPTED